MEFTLIGSGNVAYYLAKKLNKPPHSISQVYSRNIKTGKALAKFVNSEFVSDIKNLTKTSDAYIIAVNDDEIINVTKQLELNIKLVIHTSGSTGLTALSNCSSNIGVVYPLISITKSENDIPENFPVCIEANNTTSLKKCKQIAKFLSKNIKEINSDSRAALHLSAVIVNNFGNHLFVEADDLLQKNKLSLKLLEPIISQTAERIKKNKPINLQTGPAIRDDKKVMKKHLNIIGKNKALAGLYKSFSKSIFEKNKKTK